MSINLLQNFFDTTVSTKWNSVGTGNFYISVLPSVTNGYLVINRSSKTKREIIRYTGTGSDVGGNFVTVAVAGDRGLGGTTAQTHEIGEAAQMNLTAQHWADLDAALDSIIAAGAPNASTSVKGISTLSTAPVSPTDPIAAGTNDPRIPTQAENDALAGTSGAPSDSNRFVTNADTSGSGAVVRNSLITSISKFGGTGADGALTVTSGNTDIDCAGARYLERNYTSISITGTGSVTFTNPHANGTCVIVKSQGVVTLTSSATPMLSVAGMGSIGGVTTGAFSANGSNSNGATAGSTSIIQNITSNGGLPSSNGVNGDGGALPTTFTLNVALLTDGIISKWKYPNLWCGAGGGGGFTQWSSASGANSGSPAAGRGGGCLVIECGGAWNFTTTNGISVAGSTAANVGSASVSVGGVATGGPGGGAGGLFLALYNTLTANTGTVNVAGGIGGNNGTAGSAIEGRGGGGGSNIINVGAAGTNSSSNGTKVGGNGAAGLSIIGLNKEFV